MGTVRYTTVNGKVIAEKRNGVRSFYVSDSLGSTVALIDNTQTITDTFEYWPYGEVRVKTGTNLTPLQFLGAYGVHTDSPSKSYARARTANIQLGRWMTKDPTGFEGGDWNLYIYALNNPTSMRDLSGLQSDLIRSKCDERTKAYCDAANKTKNKFDNCACRIAKIICRIIHDKSKTDKMRICSDCINKCMFDHWRLRDTSEWRQADKICNDCKSNSNFQVPCCDAMVIAEQSGMTACLNANCKLQCAGKGGLMPPGNRDERFRIGFGQQLCCHGSGGNPL